MREKFLEVFNIEEKEAVPVSILLIQSIFYGIFIGAFEVSSIALFLGSYSKDSISDAYIVSGVVGILLTALYSHVQTRRKFSSLSMWNILVLGAILVMLRLGYVFFSERLINFIVFVMFGPLRIIAVVGFWGTVVRLFTLRQGKRIFGMIDAGQIMGIILSSLAVPLLIDYFHSTTNILWISAGSLFIAFAVQILVVRKFDIDESSSKHEDESVAVSKSISYREMFKDRYIRMMSIFIVLSMASAFFIYYSFLSVTKANYLDEVEIAKFTGFFNTVMYTVILIIKFFVYSKLLKTYGLKVSLALSPFLVAIFTLGAVFIGSSFGYVKSSDGFILFFLIMALNRLFSVALKESFEVPSFKILYQSLDKKIRYDVQAKIDGTVNEIAALGSGIVLYLLKLFPFFKLIHYSFVLLGIVVLWGVVSLETYKEYQRSLRKSLEKFQEGISGMKKRLKKALFESGDAFRKELELWYELNPSEMVRKMVRAYEKGAKKEKEIAEEWQRKKVAIYPGRRKVFKEKEVQESKFVQDCFAQFERKSKSVKTVVDVEKFVRSSDSADRVFAARLIEIKGGKFYNNLLTQLVRDIDIPVKKAALLASAYVDAYEFSPACLDYLSSQTSFGHAKEALVEMGDEAVDILEQAFYKTDVSIGYLVRVTSILGEIASPMAIRYLVNKLTDQPKDVENMAVKALLDLSFVADEESLPKISKAIINKVGVTAWNLAAKNTIEENELGWKLSNSFSFEIERNFEEIYNLLSLCYDPRSISQIRKNLDSGTSEGVGFAIELLDLLLEEELKPILFPLLDDSPLVEKIKKLQNYFPLDFYEIHDLLLAIMNRGSNALGDAVKIKTMEILGEETEFELTYDLIAHVFNPDRLLSETAGYILYKRDYEAYKDCTSRISAQNKYYLDRMNEQLKVKTSHLTKEKLALLLKHVLVDVPYDYVAHLAKNMDEVNFNRLYEISELKDKTQFLFIVVHGEVQVNGRNYKSNGQPVIVEGSEFQKSKSLMASEDVTIYKLPKQYLKDLVFEHPDLYTEVKELLIGQ